MKRRDLERHLRDHGCCEIDEGGNHTRWAAATGKRRSVVPRHREIDYRLARSICKQLDVPPPEWIAVRNGVPKRVPNSAFLTAVNPTRLAVPDLTRPS